MYRDMGLGVGQREENLTHLDKPVSTRTCGRPTLFSRIQNQGQGSSSPRSSTALALFWVRPTVILGAQVQSPVPGSGIVRRLSSGENEQIERKQK